MQRIVPYMVGVLFLLACSCQPATRNKQQATAIKVEVERISTQEQVLTHHYTGVIKEANSIPLSAQSNGAVTHIFVKKGDKVKAGQALLRVDTLQAHHALQMALASLTQAQDGINRAKQVYQQGGVTDQKMIELNSQLLQAQSMYNIAQQRFNDCTVKAPSDGVIGNIQVKVGQNIVPGVAIITLLDMHSYQVSFDVPESDMSVIQLNDTGHVTLTVLGVQLPIQIIEKNLLANQIAHTYTLTATLKDMPAAVKEQLYPGMVGKVALPAKNVTGIILPNTCIHTQPTGQMVWVASQGKAYRKTVTVGNYTQGGVLIVDGLAVGDTIIVKGHHKLYNGAPIYIE
ncbi:MAG: efflux RND transporter periplasmic adaptor subunit [Paludibacteraceae bacterium]|nr:efflux RND transporter periplasmic adaptor subunit [Paludibacteraceae bacterium]